VQKSPQSGNGDCIFLGQEALGRGLRPRILPVIMEAKIYDIKGDGNP